MTQPFKQNFIQLDLIRIFKYNFNVYTSTNINIIKFNALHNQLKSYIIQNGFKTI